MDSNLDAAVEQFRRLFDDWTSPSREIVNRLLDGLGADKRTAENCAGYVRDLGPVTDDVITALVRSLDFEERSARAIRSTLVAFGLPALEQLVREFRDTKNLDENLRSALLIQAIGEFGAAAATVVPDLIECLDHPMLHVRVHAAIALWRIDGRAQGRASTVVQGIAIPGLWEIIDPVIETLCEMGTEAREVLPVLVGMLVMNDPQNRDSYWLGRRGAIVVLEHMGSAAAAASPALKAAQSDPDESIRKLAIKAVESISRQIGSSDEKSSNNMSADADGKKEFS